MSILGHKSWIRLLVHAKSDQKTFRIVNLASKNNDVDAIDISIIQNEPSANDESSAEKVGWVVDIRYKNAPDTVLFTATYPSEDQARKIMEDLSNLAAEVEGLIRKEDFEQATTKTKALMDKFKANSTQPPVEENEGGTPL